MAPATITPELAPMDWMMTFSPSAFLRLAAPDTPTAMMAIGMAASNTCLIFIVMIAICLDYPLCECVISVLRDEINRLTRRIHSSYGTIFFVLRDKYFHPARQICYRLQRKQKKRRIEKFSFILYHKNVYLASLAVMSPSTNRRIISVLALVRSVMDFLKCPGYLPVPL